EDREALRHVDCGVAGEALARRHTGAHGGLLRDPFRPPQVAGAFTMQNQPSVCLNGTGMDLILARHVDRLAGPPLTMALRAMARLRGERLPSLHATTPPAAVPLSAPR